jgi:hypothetical protein
MTVLVEAIAAVRRSVVAVMCIHWKSAEDARAADPAHAEFSCSFGTAFCVVADRYVVTAHHVLNGGKPRNPDDRFYVFTVPGNDVPAYYYEVIGFPLERPDRDLAVLEPCSMPGIELPALPVSFAPRPDGTQVVTVGYPSPEIHDIKVDPQGNYRGGQFFLKSHANEGIVAAQYELEGDWMYELNVGWHHGESGGPVASAGASPAVFSVMQHYRNVQSPHGVVAGPHRGFGLSCIEGELRALGVVVQDAQA